MRETLRAHLGRVFLLARRLAAARGFLPNCRLEARYPPAARALAGVRHGSGAARVARVGRAAARGAVLALAGARTAFALVAAGLLEAALQQRHEIDHLAAGGPRLRNLSLGLGERVGLARFHLLLDAFHQVVAVGVGELPGPPVLGHPVDELQRHVELALARAVALSVGRAGHVRLRLDLLG